MINDKRILAAGYNIDLSSYYNSATNTVKNNFPAIYGAKVDGRSGHAVGSGDINGDG